MKSEEKFPVTERCLNARRKMPAKHPWRAGYPNNGRLLKELTKLGRRK